MTKRGIKLTTLLLLVSLVSLFGSSCTKLPKSARFIRLVSNDFNHDGIADVLIGARSNGEGGAGAGAAYIFYGATSLATSINASSANVKFIGEGAGDLFGFSVASGDINADGIADIIVGADEEDSGGGTAGAVYVFYGSSGLASSIDASLANIKLIGEAAGDQLGDSVASADINGDGYDDIIAGASREDTGGSAAGAVYIFYGGPNLPSSIDASLANVKLIGEAANDFFGTSLSTGDVNNNGFPDVIVGATGEDSGGDAAGAGYIFLGSATLAASIDASLANVKLIGEAAGDTFGISVNAGDINNDGFADTLVGADLEDTVASAAGAAYIFYGASTLAASIDASNANVKFLGEAGADQFGFSVSSSDVNNDGFFDAFIGANLEDSGGASSGAAYIFYGSNTLAASISAASADVKLSGESASDQLGISVGGNADINNDGLSDVITGALNGDGAAALSGTAHILFGSSSLAASISASNANVKLNGEAASDAFGNATLI